MKRSDKSSISAKCGEGFSVKFSSLHRERNLNYETYCRREYSNFRDGIILSPLAAAQKGRMNVLCNVRHDDACSIRNG